MFSIPIHEERPWQDSLADLITNPQELLELLELTPEDVSISPDVLREFPLRLTRSFAAKMQKGNPMDPLLLQVLPQHLEHIWTEGYSNDPLQESLANPVPGILHKYAGRALLMPTSSCAIHCRYCFRRHFPYAENRPNKQEWQHSLQYIRADESIHELILSGGDPLATSDRHLEWLLEHLAGITHLKRLRIHTRMPLVLPQRINDKLCELLQRLPLTCIVVIHCNHAQELDDAVHMACKQLKSAGIELFNQSVLLRGINDSVQALSALSEKLFEYGVIPYYLHLLDKVQGSSHFQVPEDIARQLLASLRNQLPGYLMPRLVKEESGKLSKTPLY
jgi:EF-P beta-lysylation protein EpmB